MFIRRIFVGLLCIILYSGAGWLPLVQSVSSAFNPCTSLSNVVGCYRADVGVSQSGGNVSAWADQSGAAQNFSTVSSPSPTWSATGFNTSYPGVSFVASSVEYIENSSFSFQSSSFSVFVLFSAATANASSNRLLSVTANGASNDYSTPSFTTDVSSSGTSAEMYSNATLGNGGSVLTISANTPTLIGYVGNGINVTAYLNGVATGAASSFSSSLGTNPNSAILGGNASLFTGTIAFVLVTTSAMSSGDIASLKAWINSTYGTSF